MYEKKGNHYVVVKDLHTEFDKEFFKTFGKYPINDKERKQFLPYLNFKKKTKKYDLMFEKI